MPTPTILDIYHGDQLTSLSALAASGIRGIIHKATQGTTTIDPKYSLRQTLCAPRFLWGAYHFGTAEDVPAQVDHFLRIVNQAPSVLLALDLERNNGSGGTMSASQALQFLTIVRNCTGRTPILYSGDLFRETVGDLAPAFTRLGVRHWNPAYGPAPHFHPALIPWAWQYTGDGIGPTPHSVLGCNFGRPCDLSEYHGASDLASDWA